MQMNDNEKSSVINALNARREKCAQMFAGLP